MFFHGPKYYQVRTKEFVFRYHISGTVDMSQGNQHSLQDRHQSLMHSNLGHKSLVVSMSHLPSIPLAMRPLAASQTKGLRLEGHQFLATVPIVCRMRYSHE